MWFLVVIWLVVEPTPLKNMSSSVGMMKFPIWWESHIIPWFQTTNQLYSPIINHYQPLLIMINQDYPIYYGKKNLWNHQPVIYENKVTIHECFHTHGSAPWARFTCAVLMWNHGSRNVTLKWRGQKKIKKSTKRGPLDS